MKLYLASQIIIFTSADGGGDVDSQWGEWSAWSTCTKSCGEGKSMRTRACNGRRSGCIGDSEQTEDCSVESCTGQIATQFLCLDKQL